MADKFIRIGRVSSIDYANGMISVTYPDLDDSVTDKLPVFNLTGEYKMPGIGDNVLALHLSNGATAGVVLGTYWNKANKPAVSGADVFRKELGAAQGEAYIQYQGGNITLHDQKATATLASIISRITTLESKMSALESKVSSLENRVSNLE